MTVNFEFLGMEPIENLITCMHFKIDKVVFFGYNEIIQSQKASAESFLRKYCGVEQVSFVSLSHNHLDAVLDVMRNTVEKEKNENHDIFFDITGGESLILVAFGILSKGLDAPMHMYDVEADELIELNENSKRKTIGKNVPERKVNLDLNRYIEMKGGLINNDLHKNTKEIDNEDFARDVDVLFGFVKKHITLWHSFAGFMRNCFVFGEDCMVCVEAAKIRTALRET
ncbi:MAG: hypothetical protein J6332_09025, partial [Abditibacteriota bacterium]|nr:hypothetical protein [Abditibacteriota bacterium]